jgi:CMP/dCMP kinase
LTGKAFIIAIDGPAASGKGTLGRRLADRFGLPHLDTGLTYRAVGQALLLAGRSLDDETLAVAEARSIDLSSLDRDALSEHSIGEAASRVAVMAGVRRVLVERQREFAAKPPGGVLDGRDIGTVVFPNADVKLFVTATPETRARRRFEEVAAKGRDSSFERILDDIRLRDERDMNRADSPLKPADDAYLIDTSAMDIETAFETAMAVITKAIAD